MNRSTLIGSVTSWGASLCLALLAPSDSLVAQCNPPSAQKLLASNGAANDLFGVSVAIDGARAAVGSRYHDTVGANDGAVYSFTKTGATWSQSAVLTASDGAAGDNFGNAVGVSGSRTVVGALSNADQGANTGSAYVFFGSTEEQKLIASDAAAGDLFGFSVAIDGHRAVVGAPADDDLGSGSGSLYVFEWTGSQWLEGAKLHAADGAANDQFGLSVAISGDFVIVGANGTDQGATNAGSAYVFEWNGSTWVQRAKLVAADAGADDDFGRSVDIDQQRAIVGAPRDAISLSDDGSAYVFTRSGTSWTQTAKLVAIDTAANRNLGYAVALAGTRAAAGAHLDGAAGTTAGAVFEFELDGSIWNQRAKLMPSDIAVNDNFGAALAASGDTLVVGSIADDDLGSSSGSAYVYERWTKRQRITASDAATGDRFGTSVSLVHDLAVVGAAGDDDLGQSSGSAYALAFNGTTWTQTAKLLASDGEMQDRFGWAVAHAGDRIAVGAPEEDGFWSNVGAASDTGAVYVFAANGSAWNQEAKLAASDAPVADRFGRAVALSPSWLAVGAEDAVYVFRKESAGWVEKAKLVPVNGDLSREAFGWSVATCGDSIVVGSPIESLPTPNPGAAYVFEWGGSSWSQSARLVPTIHLGDLEFGKSVALSGKRILIGSPGSTYIGNNGSALVFESNGAVWTESARFVSSPTSSVGRFGASVSLWGERAIVGAPSFEPSFGSPWNGAAFVFEKSGAPWVQRQELHGDYDPYWGWEENVGVAVAISGDRILCGSPNASNSGSVHRGAAYSFEVDCPREWIASYCTAGTSTNGCNAHISVVGEPIASFAATCSLVVSGLDGQRQGIVFYGMNGPMSIPWGPSSYLCVRSPTQRSTAADSGGTAGACDGMLDVCWGCFPGGPLGAPFCPGDVIWAQGWYRDPASPKTTQMSDAVEFVLLP